LTKYTVFTNAPIVEAVLDIQVDQPERVTLQTLDSMYDMIKDRFPVKEQRAKGQAIIKLSEQGPSLDAQSLNPIGYFYRSDSEKKIVQAKLDGFTFNKLKPYENWQAFCSEGNDLWNLYKEIVQPKRVKRIALRYINRIEIPLPIRDFKDYILTVPEIAPLLPQALAHFFMQLTIPNPEIEATAVIIEVIEQATEQQTLPVIFDVDVFKIVNYADNYDDLWKEFEKLRNFKNEIFFNSMTDKAKELFK
jgi:uncharacterized protein (TIGR04255 family)